MSENPVATTPSHVERDPRADGFSTAVVYYDAAKRSLEQAARVDEVKAVADEAERMRLYARQAKDKSLIADAVEIQTRAHRRLGEMIKEAKESGQLSRGGRPRNDDEKTGRSDRPVFDTVTLKEAGISKDLSSKAQKLADVEPDAFERLLMRSRERIVSEGAIVIDPVRDAKQANKRESRDERAAHLAAKHRALPQIKAGIIVADPAWKDEEIWSEESGMDRAADNHYPTMTLNEVMALDVGGIAADDAILFLWCKTNNLPEAFCVAAAWGFFAISYEESSGLFLPDKSRCRYASGFAWDKQVFGPGRWVRDQHEHLLIFRRGKPVAPAPGTQLASVLSARKTEHSAKPDAFLDWIDRCWPEEVKIELNRRGAARPGWHAWGNEVEDGEAPEAVAAPSTAVPAVPLPRFAGEDEENSELPASVLPTSPAEPGGVDQGDDPASPVSADGDDSPSALDHYRALVAADTNKGRHTRESAAEIIRASRACDPIVPVKQLAEDLGHPLGTVQGWTHKLKVTDHARLTETGLASVRRGQLLNVAAEAST